MEEALETMARVGALKKAAAPLLAELGIKENQSFEGIMDDLAAEENKWFAVVETARSLVEMKAENVSLIREAIEVLKKWRPGRPDLGVKDLVDSEEDIRELRTQYRSALAKAGVPYVEDSSS